MSLLPDLHAERCTRYRFRYSTCTRCAEQCPPGALTPNEEGVTLDAARCTGCGLCVGACPTEVFHLPALTLVLPTDPAARTLTIACRPSEQPAELRVPCLGALDVAMLAALGRRGLQVTLRGSGHCERCPHAPQGAARLQALLDALAITADPSPWPQPIVEEGAAAEGLDRRRAERRQFFRRWIAAGAEAARDDPRPAVEVPPSALRAAAHALPPRRKLAETLLRGVGRDLSDPGAARTWGLGWIEAGPNPCTGCEACARVCPTGALKTAVADDRWRLIATPAQCVGCGVCIEACTAGAIALHPGRRATEARPVLHDLRLFRCERCGRFFAGLDECPVCRDDEADFADIFG